MLSKFVSLHRNDIKLTRSTLKKSFPRGCVDIYLMKYDVKIVNNHYHRIWYYKSKDPHRKKSSGLYRLNLLSISLTSWRYVRSTLAPLIITIDVVIFIQKIRKVCPSRTTRFQILEVHPDFAHLIFFEKRDSPASA